MKFLKKLLALLLVVTVLPGKFLWYGVLLNVGLPLMSVGVLLVSIFSGIINALRSPGIFSKIKKMALLLTIAIPVLAILVTVGLIVLELVLNFIFLNTFAHTMFSGFKNAFNNGMEGFWQTYTSQRISFFGYTVDLRARVQHGFNAANRIQNQPGMEIGDMFAAAIPGLVTLPNMLEAAPVLEAESLLKTEELLQVNTLLSECTKLPASPFVSPNRTTIKKFKLLSERYKELSERLETARMKIQRADKNIEDQLGILLDQDMEKPIFLVKKYQHGENLWCSVPGGGYVADETAMLIWFNRSPTSPVNRDNIITPSRHKHPLTGELVPTRYNYHPLSKDSCYVQELGEGATEIRQLLKTVPAILEQLKKEKVTLAAVRPTLFGNQAAAASAALAATPAPGH